MPPISEELADPSCPVLEHTEQEIKDEGYQGEQFEAIFPKPKPWAFHGQFRFSETERLLNVPSVDVREANFPGLGWGVDG